MDKKKTKMINDIYDFITDYANEGFDRLSELDGKVISSVCSTSNDEIEIELEDNTIVTLSLTYRKGGN